MLYLIKNNAPSKSLVTVFYVQTSKVQLHSLIYDFIVALFTQM